MKKTLGALALALGCGGAAAQAYVGGHFGFTRQGVDCGNWSSCDKTDSGLRLYGGWRFTNALALEGGFIDFGSVQLRAGNLASGNTAASAFMLNGAFSAPLAPRLTGTVRLGLALVDADYRSNGPLGLFGSSASESSLEPYAGLGFAYALNPRLAFTGSFDVLQAEYPRGGGTATLLGAGLLFSF